MLLFFSTLFATPSLCRFVAFPDLIWSDLIWSDLILSYSTFPRYTLVTVGNFGSRRMGPCFSFLVHLCLHMEFHTPRSNLGRIDGQNGSKTGAFGTQLWPQFSRLGWIYLNNKPFSCSCNIAFRFASLYYILPCTLAFICNIAFRLGCTTPPPTPRPPMRRTPGTTMAV